MKIEGKLEKKAGEKLWGVDIPEIGIFTQGRTKKDAFEMAKESIELVVDIEGTSRLLSNPVKTITFLLFPTR